MNRVVFIGSKELGLRTLTTMHSLDLDSLAAVITIDDSSDTRSVLSKFISFCKTHKLDLIICKNRSHFNKVICNLKPDLCIVACWYWIISKEILDLVPNGFIGIHYSCLPRYRGWAPAVWQMIRGEDSVGFSVFYLTEEMDAGDLLHSGYVEVCESDCISDILKKLEAKFLKWLRTNYCKILEGSIISAPQNSIDIEPTYCTRRYPLDGEIDWGRSAKDVYNFIRAQSKPYPGAFTYYKGNKMTIWSATLTDITYYGTPGQVAKKDDLGVWVICGDNIPIVLKTIQFHDRDERPASRLFVTLNSRLGKDEC